MPAGQQLVNHAAATLALWIDDANLHPFSDDEYLAE